MGKIEDLEEQIMDLQSKYSHQQEMLESLNETVVKQWETLDKLARIVGNCADQIQSISSALDGDASEPPPPHY